MFYNCKIFLIEIKSLPCYISDFLFNENMETKEQFANIIFENLQKSFTDITAEQEVKNLSKSLNFYFTFTKEKIINYQTLKFTYSPKCFEIFKLSINIGSTFFYQSKNSFLQFFGFLTHNIPTLFYFINNALIDTKLYELSKKLFYPTLLYKNYYPKQFTTFRTNQIVNSI